MKITFLQNRKINKIQWDETILNSSNGNIYGLSWYLDSVCPGWNALTCPGYEMIMPLTANRKFGIHYIFRPMLSQQLGLFSISPPKASQVKDFLNEIPSKYKFIQYCLNKSNRLEESFNSTMHKSFELDLSLNYSDLKSGYSENHKRNLKKAEKNGCSISEDISHEEFINLLLNDNTPGSKILTGRKYFDKVKKLIANMHLNDAMRIIGLRNRSGNFISAVLFGYSHKTWYYLIPVNSEEGKQNRALFYIIDHLIKEQAGLNEILDFEGSDIDGVAKFYAGFGSKEINYPEVVINKLPWPINYLK